MNNSLPEGKAPETVVQTPAGRCKYCASVGMRRSRWRSGDLGKLLLLQWPMRCMECRKRQYGSFSEARRAVPAAIAHAGTLKAKETWRHYTGRRNPADDSLTRSGVRMSALKETDDADERKRRRTDVA